MFFFPSFSVKKKIFYQSIIIHIQTNQTWNINHFYPQAFISIPSLSNSLKTSNVIQFLLTKSIYLITKHIIWTKVTRICFVSFPPLQLIKNLSFYYYFFVSSCSYFICHSIPIYQIYLNNNQTFSFELKLLEFFSFLPPL